MALCLIALGSNLGNREKNLAQAVALLRKIRRSRLLRLSFWHETKALGQGPQRNFLNGAALLSTTLSPIDLLDELQKIERSLGRLPWGPKGGSRTIDLDLLSYDNLMMNTAALTLPHPRIEQRAFVLVPLSEVSPQWRHPRSGKSVSHLLSELYRAHRPQ